MTQQTTEPQHQAGSLEMVASEQQAIQVEQAQATRADRLLRLCEQLSRAGGTIDTGLRDMLAEVTAMEAAYLFADQMSYSETVLPEYRRNHRPSKGRGQNKTYGPELGKQAAINGAAAIMYGRALGIGMTQSLQVIHNINGKSGLDARTMQALCEKAGIRFTFDPTNNGEHATIGAERGGHKPVSSTWTMQHAQQRGYTNNPLYNSHPDEMLRAKALAECCRLIAPDVVLGLAFTYEEMQLDAETVIEKAPTPIRAQRTRGLAALRDAQRAAETKVAEPESDEPGPPDDPQREELAAELETLLKAGQVDKFADVAIIVAELADLDETPTSVEEISTDTIATVIEQLKALDGADRPLAKQLDDVFNRWLTRHPEGDEGQS